MSAKRLTNEERREVEHWRTWLKGGGKSLTHAPMALEPLLAIIDRIAPEPQP